MKPIDYYSEGIIARYKPKTALEHREKAAMATIRGLHLDDAKVLDVGCGDGFFLGDLSAVMPDGANFYGVDYSEDQINKAKGNYPFHFSTCNLEAGMPFPDGEFDVLYAGEVIEHLLNPDLFFSEAFRVLKARGHLVLSTPNLNSWINRLLFLFGYQPLFMECSTKSSVYGYGFMKRFKKQDWPVGHVRLFNRRSLTDALNDNGFRILTLEGAVFEFMPPSLKLVDQLAAVMPGIASDLVVLAQKSA